MRCCLPLESATAPAFRRRRRGFTLVEMLAVLGLIALILSVVVVNVSGIFAQGNVDAAKAWTKSMETPLTQYRIKFRRYPTSEEGLKVLIPDYTSQKEFIDPWGKPYQYRNPGVKNPKGYDLWSFGPDGVESADDIGNW